MRGAAAHRLPRRRHRHRPAQPPAGLGGVERLGLERLRGGPRRDRRPEQGRRRRPARAGDARAVGQRAAARGLAALPGAAPGRRDPRVHAQPADLRGAGDDDRWHRRDRPRRNRPRRGAGHLGRLARPAVVAAARAGRAVDRGERPARHRTGCTGADVVGAGARLRPLGARRPALPARPGGGRGLVRAGGPARRRGAAAVRGRAAARVAAVDVGLPDRRRAARQRGARRDPGAQVERPVRHPGREPASGRRRRWTARRWTTPSCAGRWSCGRAAGR